MKMSTMSMVGSGDVGYADRTVDFVVLAYPLSSVDKVVQSIPVVGYVLGKDFLSVAVRVNGPLAEPKVALTPVRDVGKGLVDILSRTVKLPVTIFNPSEP